MVPSASSETGIGLQSPGTVPEIIAIGSHTVQSVHSETYIGLQPPSTMPEISAHGNCLLQILILTLIHSLLIWFLKFQQMGIIRYH